MKNYLTLKAASERSDAIENIFLFFAQLDSGRDWNVFRK